MQVGMQAGMQAAEAHFINQARQGSVVFQISFLCFGKMQTCSNQSIKCSQCRDGHRKKKKGKGRSSFCHVDDANANRAQGARVLFLSLPSITSGRNGERGQANRKPVCEPVCFPLDRRRSIARITCFAFEQTSVSTLPIPGPKNPFGLKKASQMGPSRNFSKRAWGVSV